MSPDSGLPGLLPFSEPPAKDVGLCLSSLTSQAPSSDAVVEAIEVPVTPTSLPRCVNQSSTAWRVQASQILLIPQNYVKGRMELCRDLLQKHWRDHDHGEEGRLEFTSFMTFSKLLNT